MIGAWKLWPEIGVLYDKRRSCRFAGKAMPCVALFPIAYMHMT